MRRLLLAAIVFVPSIALLVPAHAAEREVHGSVAAPTATAPRAQRCVENLAGDQGTVGWTIRGVQPGRAFTVEADDSASVSDFDITFYSTLVACEQDSVGLSHANVAGNEAGSVPQGANVALVTLHSGPSGSFTYREFDSVAPPSTNPSGPQGVTVVAVLDGGFNPYHFDFVGHQHPWNRDSDPSNDINFSADPSTYISGHPGATPIQLTVPTSPTATVTTLHTGVDKTEWAKFQSSSTLPNSAPKVHWFPGTKIVGAVSFDGAGSSFWGGNESHGTRSAASAAGNLHGTCAECVFVLVHGAPQAALTWAASQPWIDVITNSYGNNTTPVLRDNIWLWSPLKSTKAGVEAGTTIVFSAGNGLANAFDVPAFTYWSSQKGPDWMVTVGAVDPRADQQYSGAGKPADISSYGSDYPSTGGITATGEGTHSGTSNAAPVTAGTIARVIQRSRTLLGDTTEGHSNGVVASGQAIACGAANAACPLGDGVLTRAEAERAVFHNVLPSKPAVAADTVWPSTSYNYYYQGHGVISGRLRADRYSTEQRRFNDFLVGDVMSLPRPAGETNWMIVDSKCRQKIWGEWTGGYFNGATPALDPVADSVAFAFDSWCTNSPLTLKDVNNS